MKKITYMALGLVAIMGILSVGVANADPYGSITYSLTGHEGTYYANDLELYFFKNAGTVSHYTIMDRNLGASDVYNQDWAHQNTESYGYVYQRGNNYGFASTSSDFIEGSTSTYTQVPKSVRSTFLPSLYSSNIRYGGANSWMGSGSTHDNIWGGAWDTEYVNGTGTTVDRQGPCPNDYYIPSVSDWSDIRMAWFTYANRGNRTGAAYDLLLPSAGMRSGAAVLQGGEYRTSSPSGDPDRAYALYLGSEVYNSPIPTRSRSRGVTLRCFKKDFQSDGNLEFHLNGGGTGLIAVSEGKFTSMLSPKRSNSNFEGWYTTPDFETGTKVGVGSGTNGATGFYAKRGCLTGYVLSGDACVEGTIVTFNINWISQTSITVPYGTVLDFSGEVVNLSNGTTVTITGVADAYPGETFAGWGTGNNGSLRTIKTLVIEDEDVTLHAIFRSNFTIRFNATENGGETNTGSISVPYGTIIDLSEYTATKGSSGVRTFLGWNTYSGATSGFSNMYKAENEEFNETTLYAIFRKDKFYVNFDTNGHGITPSPQTINRGDKIESLNLTDPGYKFEGWSDNEYLTTDFDFGVAPTDDVTLYAKWRVPGAECFEGFEYDNNLGMCIKKNEWVVRVGLDGGIIISSGYSDFLEDLVSLLITGDYKSKMWDFDIAKNYYGVMLAAGTENDVLHVSLDYSLSDTGTGNIVEVFEGSRGSGGDLLFTMVTKVGCRSYEPNCKFYNQNIEVAEGVPDWYNLKLFLSEDIKQGILGGIEYVLGGPVTGIVRADNVRIIFDPRVVVTFDSNGHGVSPERQFLNKGSKVTNPGSLSAEGYKFLGWSDDEYLIFDFNNTVVNKDTKLYAKWKPIGYSCPEGQEYDESVGFCKKPTDWVIRIGYNGDMEFSSGYSLFLDKAILNDIKLEEEMDQSEVEVFKKALGILIASLEIFDGTDEIMIDEAGIVPNGDFYFLDYLNKDGKLLFTVVVDMAGTEFHSSGLSFTGDIHTRSMYVSLARDVSSSDNLKLTPSSTSINEYVEAYPPIAQLENLWIIFSDRMEPNVDNGGGSSGGGHGQGGSDEANKVDENSSEESQDDSTNIDSSDSSDEFQQAYEFAYKNGITTMDTIQKADMQGPLTRIAMAKMLSNYAINVLGKKPANIVVPDFKDITNELDEQYDFGVTLGYQLGIMGINMPDNKFRPFDYVTRAEFATALSRMLFSTPDGDPYYVTHLAKLKEEGIITNDDPSMKELRGYVMIMLMRSAKE